MSNSLNDTQVANLKAAGYTDRDISLFQVVLSFTGEFDQDVVGLGVCITSAAHFVS
jgi:hypothetical protein